MGSPNPKTSHAPGTAKPTPPPNFDTMSAMEMLMKTGFAQDQASAIVGAVRDAQRELATKADLDRAVSDLKANLDRVVDGLRADSDLAVSDLKADLDRAVNGLRADSDLAVSDLKANLYRAVGGLKADSDRAVGGLKAEIQELRTEIASQFSQLYRYLLIGAGVCVTSLAGIWGMMLALMGGM